MLRSGNAQMGSKTTSGLAAHLFYVEWSDGRDDLRDQVLAPARKGLQ
jgi:hypothetical protein